MITLAWPDTQLWPNRPSHWTAVHRRRKAAKEEAWAACLEAGLRNTGADRAHIAITFRPPNRRRFDLDNALAAIKGHLDGISLAIGIDDSRFDVSVARGEPAPGGRVVVEITR